MHSSSSSSSSSNIKCIAIIGKQNQPLYIRSLQQEHKQDITGREHELKFHYFIHSALDVVEEKVLQAARVAAQSKTFIKPYLGLLCPIENYKLHGYLTNTKIKFILVLEDSVMKDSDIADFFSKLHHLYMEYMCNPFNEPQRIVCEGFDSFVDRLVMQQSNVGSTAGGGVDVPFGLCIDGVSLDDMSYTQLIQAITILNKQQQQQEPLPHDIHQLRLLAFKAALAQLNLQ